MRTLLINARVYSPGARDASALLVSGSEIAWLGDAGSAADLSAERTVDLAGALVIPAFVDAHFHTTDTGLSLSGLELGAAGSLAEALQAVERAARASGGRPLLGSGWDETRWPQGRAPTAAELDRASYGGVVYLARTDAHSAVVSSALLASVPGIAGLDGYSADGRLTKAAHHAARAVARSAITAGQRAELQRVALRQAASYGVAAVHEMAGPEISSAEDLAALLALVAGHGKGGSEAEPYPEVFGYWGELHGAAAAAELGAVGAGGDLFCDGSIGSHTAGMLQPYLDLPTGGADARGYLRYDTAELAEHLIECTEAGLQGGFHAIGDAATGQVVAAMRLAAERLGSRIPAAGHRIEHAELIGDVPALAATGLIASVQPAFDATWGGDHGMYAQRLGVERARRLNPLAEFAAAGVPLAFGADSPVTPVDPWGAVRAAVHPSNPAHALSPRAALTAHTRGGWRAARADADGSGVLAPGAPASYAVFAAGPLAVDAADERLSRWSTDERSGVPGLPDLAPGGGLPRCLRT
ncbi:MAG TPA: amidohydrolase family protein, partial [Jatrophihabitans sp.]|nr:amidohydrolase family protein [Jatrophihabitans sp.]